MLQYVTRSVDVQGMHESAFTAPSVATREFALSCLLTFVDNAASDTELSGTVQACLPAIVQCIFGVLEDKVDGLKSTALAALSSILRSFASLPDPDNAQDGGLLMDAFAAPYVTALKACLATVSASPVVAQAAHVAAGMLTCGMLRVDPRSTEV